MTPDELLAMDLDGGDDDWTPTPHGRHMAETLARHNVVEGRDILELGGGVGNHTVLLLRQGVRSLVTTEISVGRSETTRRNVEHNCGPQDQVEYRVADWLNVKGDFDGIVCNPPFARSGRRNRRWFIDDLILNGSRLLREGGTLTFVQSSMADLGLTRRDLERNGYDVDILGESRGPFRDYYFEDETFMEEIRQVPDGFEMEGETYFERLYVVHATLRPWTPPAGAHS